MHPQAQQAHPGMQGRIKQVVTAAVLAVTLAVAGVMPVWAQRTGETSGGGPIIQGGPPVNDCPRICK